MIKVNDIGLCKALTLDGNDEVGRLCQIGDSWFLSSNIIDLHENGNVKKSVNTLVQIMPDTVCAYTYMNDKFGTMIFEFDVLSLPDNTDLLIYIYYDSVRGMYLYHTNKSIEEESNMEPLNINELVIVGNITRNDKLCELFNDKGDC